jgi:hypothetical protein
VAIVLPMALAMRLNMRVERQKVGTKNLKTIRIRNGIRKKIDKAHALDPQIVKVHASPMLVQRQLMQTRFLVL